MRKKHPPVQAMPAIGAGLPFQGRHGGKAATLVTLTLLTAAGVVAWLTHKHPSAAPVVFFLAAFLVVSFWLTLHYLGPRWAVAWVAQTAIVAVLAAVVVTTQVEQRPADRPAAKAASVSASVGSWLDRKLGHEPEKAKPAKPARRKPTTTTRRSR